MFFHDQVLRSELSVTVRSIYTWLLHTWLYLFSLPEYPYSSDTISYKLTAASNKFKTSLTLPKMCLVFMSFCKPCRMVFVLTRICCCPDICDPPEYVAERPQPCSMHALALTYPASQNTSNLVPAPEPIQHRRGELRKEAMARAFYDIQEGFAQKARVLTQAITTMDRIERSLATLALKLNDIEHATAAWVEAKNEHSAAVNWAVAVKKEAEDARCSWGLCEKEKDLEFVKREP